MKLLDVPLNTVLHNIPIPPRNGGPGRGHARYRFADMEPGDCIITIDAMVADAATNWAWENGLSRKWTKRALGEGRYGLWRVA